MKYNFSNICKMANDFHKRFGMSLSEAFKKAWMNAKLNNAMKTGIVKFYFIKKTTGELREAFGTTDPHRYSYTPTGEGRHGNFADCVQYYDTEKQGFRMFKTYNLVRIA